MCGIFGIATNTTSEPWLDNHAAIALRDMLAHRGPDGVGLLRLPNAILTHRRLAVRDLTSAAEQPLRIARDGRVCTIVYNGELYNEAELRGSLGNEPIAGTGDTGVFAHALAHYGVRASFHLRGMYAGAMIDARDNCLLLTRDPLGVKPLYWTRVVVHSTPHVAFSSEAPVLARLIELATGSVPLPDLAAVSSYLTTLRTELGSRSLFQGVSCVLPGQTLRFDLTKPTLPASSHDWWAQPARAIETRCDFDTSAVAVRNTIEDSVARHLLADVSVCALLSGGLDSSIIVHAAKRHGAQLETFCSGCNDPGSASPDFAFAQEASRHFGTRHTGVNVTRHDFSRDWPALVQRKGLPLSTPNEVAIYTVARALRERGHTVTLSGEGADELFAGYDTFFDTMRSDPRGTTEPAKAALDAAAWINPTEKSRLLRPEVWRMLEHDDALYSYCEDEFESLRAQCGDDDPRQVYCRWLRRTNMVSLLQRFDACTMLAGVEGRVPFADINVAMLAESLPFSAKFGIGPCRGKRVLREAFAHAIPPAILSRPKASFPIPYEHWLIDRSGLLPQSVLCTALFHDEVIQTIAHNPIPYSRIAWPLINLAEWSMQWWPAAA